MPSSREPRGRQVIELFHLAFLQVLQARLDQSRYVLKGGANLRYFFDSVRYSEDIDLDLLLRRQPVTPGTINSQILGNAAERGLALPFEAFRDQVLPFLDPEVTELYDATATWEQMQLFVADTLLGAQ
jgi:hypothetical protein